MDRGKTERKENNGRLYWRVWERKNSIYAKGNCNTDEMGEHGKDGQECNGSIPIENKEDDKSEDNISDMTEQDYVDLLRDRATNIINSKIQIEKDLSSAMKKYPDNMELRVVKDVFNEIFDKTNAEFARKSGFASVNEEDKQEEAKNGEEPCNPNAEVATKNATASFSDERTQGAEVTTDKESEKKDLAFVPSFALGVDYDIVNQVCDDINKEHAHDVENEDFVTPKQMLREKSTRVIKSGPYAKSPHINRIIDINAKYTSEDITMWRYMSMTNRDGLNPILANSGKFRDQTASSPKVQVLNSYVLIDNIKRDEEPKKYYGKIPNIMHSHFIKYLQGKGFEAMSQTLRKLKISCLRMPWQTQENTNDCAIFLMRHMKTFMGNTKSWKSNLKTEGCGHLTQMVKLRTKYNTAILTSHINEKSSAIISEAEKLFKDDAENEYKFCTYEPKPEQPAADAPEDEKEYYKRWIKADEMSRCYILAAVSGVLQHQHQSMATASDMLFNLKELFRDQNRAARLVAMKALMNTQMAEGTPVKDHVLKMMSHLNEIEILGAELDGETQIDIILMSLSKSFEQFRLNYNMNKRQYSLAELLTELQAAEGLFRQSVQVNVADKGSFSKPKGIKKKKKAQTQKAVKAVGVQGGVKKPKGKCFRCKQSGHWKHDCPLPKKTTNTGVPTIQNA
ncbi:hypothetical protein AgCh_035452 [Apium graveolens]